MEVWKRKWKLSFACFVFLVSAVGGERADECVVAKRKINTAFLTIDTEDVDDNITLQYVTSECRTCPLQNIAHIGQWVDSCTVLVDTRWPMYVAIVGSPGQKPPINCSPDYLSHHFKEGGNYSINVTRSKGVTMCHGPTRLNSPPNANIPIFVVMGIFAALVLLWIGFKRLQRSQFMYRFLLRYSLGPVTFMEPDLGTSNVGVNVEKQGTPKKERLRSLDTFRGLCLTVMCFVNYGGGGYWFLDHSDWNGLTVADLVFPWFVWIMGTAMAYSFQSLLRRATPKKQIFWKIFKRSCILFLLGLMLNCDGILPPHMLSFRIPGTLQRLAGTYLVTATIHMFFSQPTDQDRYTRWSVVRDITNYPWEWLINLIFVALWVLLIFLLPVPGCPTGYLGPGGLANDSVGHDITNCTGGAASYIDRTVFGNGHMYQTPTCKEIYSTRIPYDPEGLLGTLTSCFLCFLGLQAGKILLICKDYKARVRRFLVWAVVLGAIGTLLCKGRKDGGWIPVNTNLWTITFVLVLASMAFLLLTFCYLTIDVYKLWSGAPFYYPGMNSIFMYAAHLVLQQFFPVQFYVDPASHGQLLAMHLWGATFWCLVTYKMHRDGLYFTI